MSAPALTKRTCWLTYLALMVLLVLTALASKAPLGEFKTAVSLVIAAAKMLLVFLFFMQLRYHRGLIRVFAAAGFFWLLILGVLSFTDYLTRNAG